MNKIFATEDTETTEIIRFKHRRKRAGVEAKRYARGKFKTSFCSYISEISVPSVAKKFEERFLNG
jgi:hypothetical protein